VVGQHRGQQGLVGQQLLLAHAQLGQQRAKAALVGANIVNGPGPDRVAARSAASTASTRFGEQRGEGGVGGREHGEGSAAAEGGRQVGGGNGLCQQLRAGVGAQHVDQVARRGVFVVATAGAQQGGGAEGQQRGATGKSGRNGLHGHLHR
jgi:hypothetical protein